MRPTVVSVAAWGDKFLRLAAENVFECLLAPGQLDNAELKSHGALIIHVAAPRDREPAELDALEHLGHVIFSGFDPGDAPPAGAPAWEHRQFQAAREADAFRFAALAGADWLPLNADTVISNRYVVAVKRRLAAGARIVFGAPFRLERESFYRATACPRADLYAVQSYRRDFSAGRLYRLSLEHMHPITRRYFMLRDPATIPADPHQVFFATGEGFVGRQFQFYAQGIACHDLPAAAGLAGATFDCHLPGSVLAGTDRRETCFLGETPGEAWLASLDDAAGIAAFGSFDVTPAQVAASARNFIHGAADFEQYRWALGQRVRYPVPEALRARLPKPGECLDEGPAMAGILARLENAGAPA